MKTRDLFLIACLVAAGAIWFAGWSGEAEEIDPGLESSDVVLPVAACDPGVATCYLDLPGDGRMIVEFSAHPPQALRPFIARATLEPSDEVRGVQLNLSGVDMDMGIIDHTLQKDDDGSFKGEVVLPICVTGVMRWQADFIVEYADTRVVVPLIFSNGK